MKKLKRSKSYLSMENLDPGESDHSLSDEEKEKEEKNSDEDEKKQHQSLAQGLSKENIIIHPENVLESAFSKVNAVGSATALVGIRN